VRPWSPVRLHVELALALSAAIALCGSATARAQAYRSPLSAFATGGSQLSHAEPDPRWDGVTFPARKSRLYKRAPKRVGIEQRRQACETHFAEAAHLYRLPVDFLRAVAHIESGFDVTALSVDGAMGIMQLMPFTARKMGVTRPEDARQNILGGARFLRILANQWSGNIVLTLASYNAGAGAVKKYGGVPPYAETQRYVRRVLTRFQAYSEARKRQMQPPTPASSAPSAAAAAVTTANPQPRPEHLVSRGKQHVPTSAPPAPIPADVATLPVGSRRRPTGDHS
jgi:soluble lytic murein transglycosylase-like protein